MQYNWDTIISDNDRPSYANVVLTPHVQVFANIACHLSKTSAQLLFVMFPKFSHLLRWRFGNSSSSEQAIPFNSVPCVCVAVGPGLSQGTLI